MSDVAIVRCETYDKEEVLAALGRAAELLGGMERFVKKGEKILLKPNLLAGDPPEKCVTTHPVVFWAAAKLAKQAGAVLSYGDSPGIVSFESAARKSGVYREAVELNIPAADFSTGVDVSFPIGRQNKRFTIAAGAVACDGLISLPKLKTHALEKYTGAIKNQFGCIPGTLKAEFHVKLPDADSFALMLLDLNACIKPRLCIMDAIAAMEGNGPRGGNPVKIGALLVSDDPLALDAAACRIINLDEELVPVLRLGRVEAEELRFLGETPEALSLPSFKVDRTPLKMKKNSAFIRFAGNRWLPKPVIDKRRCLKCGICVRACPVAPAAIYWKKANKSRPPVYAYERCIRCYCCQEMCPERAVKLQKPIIRRIFEKIRGSKQAPSL